MATPHKGDRAPLTVWGPPAHKDLYEQRAESAGLPLGDYAALVLARAHGFDDPAHLRAGIQLRASSADNQLMLFVSGLPNPERMPKADRVPLRVRVPRSHRSEYELLAKSLGLALGNYYVLALAKAHGLEVPCYIGAPAGAGPSGTIDGRRPTKTVTAA